MKFRIKIGMQYRLTNQI